MVLSGWKKTLSKFFLLPQRVNIALMGFLSIAISYSTRTSLSFALTKMVVIHSGTVASTECIANGNTTFSKDVVEEPDFTDKYEWSEELQGLILASYYIGYVISHVPGGILSTKFGSKYVLLAAVGGSSLATLLSPIIVYNFDATGFIIVRVISGLAEGILVPALGTVIAAWIPLKERSTIGTSMLCGAQLGSVFGSLMSGYFLSVYEGWDSVFYFFYGLGLLWTLADPESHPFISDREKAFLVKELGQLARTENLPSTPWIDILLSIPFLGIIFGQIGYSFGFFVLTSNLPRYMANVLKVPINENGIYSSLPFAAMFVVACCNGYVTDKIIEKKYLSIRNTRILCGTISTLAPAIFIIGAAYAECDRTVVIVMFALSMGCMGTYYAGIKSNMIDLSPNYTGELYGISNGIGSTTGFAAPYLVGLLTPNSLMMEWRLLFWITVAFLVGGTVIYAVTASGDIQSWNEPKSSKKIKSIT